MAKFLSATLDDDWVRITYGTTDRAPVFYLSVAEVDELHALAHGDPDGQSDNIDQMLDQRLNERREKCICPVCGDPETHANDCEIGAAEAEVERLRAELEEARRQLCNNRESRWEAEKEAGRLRETLEWVDEHDQTRRPNGGDPEWFAEQAPIRARKALYSEQ